MYQFLYNTKTRHDMTWEKKHETTQKKHEHETNTRIARSSISTNGEPREIVKSSMSWHKICIPF